MTIIFTEKSYTSQDGLNLYYRDYAGDGLPILCLAGLSRNSKDFHKLALHLNSKGHRVLCPDYRGRGKSDYDPSPMNYLPPAYIGDILHLLTAINIHEIALIGTSLGGILAMGMGVAMPTCLKGVILNDVGPDINEDGLDRIIAYLSRNPKFDSWEAAIRDAKAIFQMVSFASEKDWPELAKATFKEYPNGKIGYDWDINILEPFKQKMPTPDLWPLFKSLNDIPLLAIRGEKSDILTPETLAKMQLCNPNMAQATIPGVGHVPSLTEEISLKAIDDFLHSL